MKLSSHIDFPAFTFQKYNARKELMAVATVTALFDITIGGRLLPSQAQRDIQLSDEFGEDNDRPPRLIRTSDFAPYRPATDVTALACAYAPGGKPQASWLVGLRVGATKHVLRVHGPRSWTYDRWAGWKLSEGEPTDRIPLEYAKAYGGPVILPHGHPDTGAVDIWNPAGTGVLTRDTPRSRAVRAAQIEHIDSPITDPYERYQPQGFAPIAPVWRFREQYTGTYDETWIKTLHPFLPPDFDPRFYNVAHPAMQFDPFLRGDESIGAANLFHDRSDISFALPGLAFGAVATHDSGMTVKAPMALDGVHLELLGTVPQVRLTWRTSLLWRDGIKVVDLGPVDFAVVPRRTAEAAV